MNQFLNTEFRTPLGLAHRTLDSFDFPDDQQRFKAQCELLLEEVGPHQGPKVFSFTFGIPDQKTLDQFRLKNFVIMGTATSIKEAQELDRANIDGIVLQGREAGGHRGTFLPNQERSSVLVPTMELLQSCLDAGIKTPLICSGGVSNGANIAAMIKAGASAVQVGSAFIPCIESGSPDNYKDVIAKASQTNQVEIGTAFTSHPPNQTDIVFTKCFTGRYARAINNKFIELVEKEFGDDIPPFPIQHILTTDIRKTAMAQGNTDLCHLWIGGSAKLSKKATSTKSIMEELIKDYERSK
ncbi:hypothetical protein SAMD00019534_075310 [Acytostelium subglobosum LB1]|uniref:hypothetical protein n=1 Tax=Acytostelium subglobosum LB1 TaxID=1410327 RepID=UPI000644C6BA|nr:hypothetical protein SAMD00019534_075310 [Acytostelium subglobosum LB1]GAM24356.1 hypothetical protein SAMD00019534_075310 [Acytostelium subglobosum LB1]|eukprot:XP_012752682.1 hypothetical protein SAMD00019534_075310 [Acytostelium subglobosum LB1]